jgi:hypothetical protein
MMQFRIPIHIFLDAYLKINNSMFTDNNKILKIVNIATTISYFSCITQ